MEAAARSKTIAAIEDRLAQIEPGTPRAHVLEAARAFKNNWVELGQRLAEVLDRKLYEKWGYDSFDRYVTAELHLKRETAYKLVRTFSFVRAQKPEYLEPERREQLPPITVVDFISKKQERDELPPDQLSTFTEQAFENSWGPRTVSAKWRDLVSDDRQEIEGDDKSVRAVRRARELAERLNKALIEIPGLDARALDALNDILQTLDGTAA
ncbi:MAG: hypothetical protein IT381_22950 [Deltaproteobacteria bacterium]|nr:hypothetical protein [Deltaproteobacteria bacterium]